MAEEERRNTADYVTVEIYDQTYHLSGQNTDHIRELAARVDSRMRAVAAQGRTVDSLRVAVLAGGCSGFQYKFELDRNRAEDDVVIGDAAAKVFIDPASLDLLAGAELDYTDSLMGAHFAVKNPNASSACGCGTSFSVD